MNILLWVVQILLAALFISGGAYKASKSNLLVTQVQALSAGAWKVIGVLEIVGGLLLLAPPGRMPGVASVAAAVLTVEALILAALYARRSLKLTAANPLVYAVVMAVLSGFVAIGRHAFSALA
jgi:hypothetical protein